MSGGGNGVEHRLHPGVGGVRVALDGELDQRVVAVLGQGAALVGAAQVLDLAGGPDRVDRVGHGRLERGCAGGQPTAVDQHHLRGRGADPRADQDLRGPAGLAGVVLGVVQIPLAGHGAEHGEGDHGQEPYQDRGLSVPGAPATQRSCQIASIRHSHSCISRILLFEAATKSTVCGGCLRKAAGG